jgi:hypothetical protein
MELNGYSRLKYLLLYVAWYFKARVTFFNFSHLPTRSKRVWHGLKYTGLDSRRAKWTRAWGSSPLILHDPLWQLIWRKLIQEYREGRSVWDNVKKLFPKTYDHKYLAQTTCSNFADATWSRGPARLSMTKPLLCDSKPKDLSTVHTHHWCHCCQSYYHEEGRVVWHGHVLRASALPCLPPHHREDIIESLGLTREVEVILQDLQWAREITTVKSELQF